jgi:hypothetical protein
MAYVDADLGVIKEARRRQRRRRSLTAALLFAAAVGVTIVGTHRHDASPPPPSRSTAPPPPQAVMVAPHVAFWQAPYMGVACPIPNSIACDRIGLAVWLRRPAVAVTASIDGTTLRLWTGPRSPSAWTSRPTNTGFTAYLQPAGLLTAFHVTPQSGTSIWYGAPTPSPMVRFRIDYGHGHVVTTQRRVPLMAGWG